MSAAQNHPIDMAGYSYVLALAELFAMPKTGGTA